MTLSGKQRTLCILFALALGATLGLGFVSTSLRMLLLVTDAIGWQPNAPLNQILAFPLLAALFYVSLPTEKETPPAPSPNPFTLSLLPLLIGALYGAFLPGNFTLLLSAPQSWPGVLWYVLAVPLGEELLFRGWLYRVTARLWPDVPFTLTNPLPVKVWVPAIAFSLWHAQNALVDPLPFVALQMAYTLFAGLWLGYLRWITGKMWIPIAAHGALNLVTNLL